MQMYGEVKYCIFYGCRRAEVKHSHSNIMHNSAPEEMFVIYSASCSDPCSAAVLAWSCASLPQDPVEVAHISGEL